MKKMMSFIALAIVAAAIFTGCRRESLPTPSGPANTPNGTTILYPVQANQGLIMNRPGSKICVPVDINGDGWTDVNMYCDDFVFLDITIKFNNGYRPVWITWSYDTAGNPMITSVY